MTRATISDDFVDRCRLVAGAATTSPVVMGAQNLVLLDASTAWRFPLRRAGCASLGEMADRMAVAGGLGLGVPPVTAVVPGPPGYGHLELARVSGTPLLTALAQGDDVELAVEQALTRLRRTRASQWPFPQLDWVDMWLNFCATARRHRRELPHEDAGRLIAAADRAAAVARDAPIRVVHGDLASDNIMVGADGHLAGILDWDAAVVGDPAIDAAAVLHVVPAEVSRRLQSRHPWLRRDLRRWDAYRDTWELQNLMWKLGLTPPLWAGTGR